MDRQVKQNRGKQKRVRPATLEEAPAEIRQAVTMFLETREPLCMPMPAPKLWQALTWLAYTHRFSVRLAPELECLALLDEGLVPSGRPDGRNAPERFHADLLRLPEAQGWALHAALQHFRDQHASLPDDPDDPVRPGLRPPLIPKVPGDFVVDRALLDSLQAARRALPVAESKAEILAAVAHHRVVVLDGPTGTGKSTQVPQYIVDAPGLLPADAPVVIVTQPRRLAAVGVASRVAEERGQEVGQEVGYQVRFESVVGPNTRIIFMTSGILLRRLHDDPALKGVGCVIIDEVHERTLDIDFILLLMKQSLLGGCTDARLVVMSATLQASTFTDYFAEVNDGDGAVPAPVPNTVHFEGRTYPVKDFYLEDALAWTGFEVDPQFGEAVPSWRGPVDCAAILRKHLQPEAVVAFELPPMESAQEQPSGLAFISPQRL
uniref:Helicase ATP-binding domain-containing protein n=1 Tax=Eutreptiella gymnastica TaxID=73025 RepID=A0A7S1HTN6_9EUGL|mmetsp:Transcript_1046/g.2214  ORF Transcript_1046/g.2214 Transcript_1046/m.2214 type:complete len:434 (+) Transcript_1046:1-1302(+)